jgi:hypothetical protein
VPTPRRGSKEWTHQAVNIIYGNVKLYEGSERYPAIITLGKPQSELDAIREMGTDLLE